MVRNARNNLLAKMTPQQRADVREFVAASAKHQRAAAVVPTKSALDLGAPMPTLRPPTAR